MNFSGEMVPTTIGKYHKDISKSPVRNSFSKSLPKIQTQTLKKFERTDQLGVNSDRVKKVRLDQNWSFMSMKYFWVRLASFSGQCKQTKPFIKDSFPFPRKLQFIIIFQKAKFFHKRIQTEESWPFGLKIVPQTTNQYSCRRGWDCLDLACRKFNLAPKNYFWYWFL